MLRPLLVGILAGAALAQEPADLVLLVGHAIPVSAPRAPDQAIVVRGGRIEAVLPRVEAPPARVVREFPHAYAFPGLIDAATGLGLLSEAPAGARALAPAQRVSDGLDLARRELAEARQAGLVAAAVLPSPAYAVGGLGALLGWRAGGSAVILDPERLIHMSLEEARYDAGIAPTTAEGALPGILQAISRPEAAARPLWVRFGQPGERELAHEIAARAPERTVFVAPPAAFPRGRLESRPRGIVLTGVAPAMSGPDREAVRRLGALGVPLALSSEPPARPAAWLRVSAISLAGILGDPDRAAAAVTLVPARLLGLEAETGCLAPGRRADITLWTRDPLDPRARLIAVLAAGAWIVPPPESED
jgi:imidazolonepropionase-like amidohydrolase